MSDPPTPIPLRSVFILPWRIVNFSIKASLKILIIVFI